MNNSPHPIIVINPDTSVRYVNPALEKLTGYSTEEILGTTPPYIWWTESTQKKTHQDFDKALQTGAKRVEELFIKKNGELFWVEITSMPTIVNGKINYYLANWVDITEHKWLEKNLQQRETLLNTTEQLTKVGGWEWDVEKKTMFWTDEVYRIHDFQQSEFPPGSTEHIEQGIECYDPKDRPVIMEAFRNCVEKAQPYDLEFPFNTLKGRRIWIRTIAKPIKKDGTIVKVIGNIIDISARKRANETLRESEEKYRVLAEECPISIMTFNQKGMVTFVNKWHLKTFAKLKHGPEFFVGKKITELPGLVRAEVIPDLEKVLQGKSVVLEDVYFPEFTGGHAGYQSIKAVPTYKNGEVVGGILIRENVTERKQAEKKLQESEQQFRTVADFTYDWEYWVEPNGHHIYVSPSCKRITGYTPDDFKCNPGLMKEIVHPEDKSIFTKHHHDINKPGDFLPIEFRIINKDGNEHWIGHICQDVYDTDGKFLGRRGSNRDITEQKKLQEEVLKARKLESLGELAGGIAHDFNNLLYVVMGNISLAQDDLKSEIGTSKSLKDAEEACIKATELTARLITFSKGGDPVKKIISIGDLLKDTVISALKEFNIKSKISITDAIRQVNIDENQIRQVIRNIVVNAKEAMDDSDQFTVSCKNIDIAEEGYLTLAQGEYIKISFADQGCGISKENLEKIFDPYFSTKDMGVDKGQGLGLTVSYSILQKHGGLINVESELGVGSTFSVYLPAFTTKDFDLQKPVGKSVAQKSVKQPAIGTGKILLMDDEETIRTFLGQVIKRLGYDVRTCTEGKETVEIYKKAIESKGPFDMVILDLTNKVGMGGQETMKRLLEIDHNAKGIVITGYSNDPVVTNYKEYGFSGFLTKPATRDELSKVIKGVLSKGQ